MADRPKTITIFGTSKTGPGDEVFESAGQMAQALAQKGFIIANGGYGGTMLAAAKSASQAQGEVIGVTCSAFGRSGANKYITKEIVTHSLEERLKTLIELGDAYVVFAGGTGTLLELAQAWELKNKHFPGADKPIILVGRFWKELVDLIASADPESIECLKIADTALKAAEMIDGYF